MSDPSRLIAVLAAGTLAALAASPAWAQAPDLSGKTVQMIIGFGSGGGYNRWGRAVGRHIGKHLPGKPNVVPQNMPGGGSLTAANHIYNVAPKDGTVMGIIARDATLAPLSGMKGARFDPLKMTWLGTPTTDTNVCFVHRRAKVQSFQDLLEHELIVGNNGVGTGTYAYPKALNGLLGTKFKLVSGFKVSTDVLLAMERGEVNGYCQTWDSAYNARPNLFNDGTFKVLFQAGAELNPTIKAPSIFSFAKTPEQKQALEYLYVGQGIGRPFIAPPGLPPAVLKMVRDAFNATMKDSDYIAEVKKMRYEHDPKDGVYLEKLIKGAYGTPKAIIDRVGALIK
ncbi:MAG: Bug family tripartite tricarboxylate transporter substrate binding protein [Xanthobacteraceae bacterium]